MRQAVSRSSNGSAIRRPVSTRRVVGTALREILQEQGMGVCGTAFGRQLGSGLFEFRLREGDLLLRAFCHAYGDKVIVLLAAYDKSEDPSAKRQRKVPVRQAATCKLDLFSLARDAATCRRASAVRSG